MGTGDTYLLTASVYIEGGSTFGSEDRRQAKEMSRGRDLWGQGKGQAQRAM